MANIFELFDKIKTGGSHSSGAVEYLIVGLGNPGERMPIQGITKDIWRLIPSPSSLEWKSNAPNLRDLLLLVRFLENSACC